MVHTVGELAHVYQLKIRLIKIGDSVSTLTGDDLVINFLREQATHGEFTCLRDFCPLVDVHMHFQ